MSLFEYFVNLTIAVLLIVGGYQIYFTPQRRPWRKAIELPSALDNKIPFVPEWVWVYSILYYPIILLLVVTIDDYRSFNMTVFSFILLLFLQIFAFYIFPVRTPHEWRNFDNKTMSTRLLALVHKYDSASNCFPSMHVSVATLTALHLNNNLSEVIGVTSLLSFLFPILIAISTLFTKQHYVIDIPPGAVLGYFSYMSYCYLYQKHFIL